MGVVTLATNKMQACIDACQNVQKLAVFVPRNVEKRHLCSSLCQVGVLIKTNVVTRRMPSSGILYV